MNQNTVFLLITAMAANFYQYIVSLPLMCLFGVVIRLAIEQMKCVRSTPEGR